MSLGKGIPWAPQTNCTVIIQKDLHSVIGHWQYPLLNNKSKNRLSTKQSGNKQWHSTETSLINTTDSILSAMDKKELTAVVLLDMSKAFDSISHEILLSKLQSVGTSPSTTKWFHSYLSHRSQVVRIGSTISDLLPVTSGVPQGSILGPLLFSIYVDDLPSVPQICSSECYVDDTKLYVSFPLRAQATAINSLNQDLQRICNWCFNNLLRINIASQEQSLI